MLVKIKKKPRIFNVGKKKEIKIKDMGSVSLRSNEQLTFMHNKNEYDITKKNWGFYATPSVNDRLKKNNFHTALVKNIHNQYYVMIIDKEKIREFKKYLKSEKNKIVKWLSKIKLKKKK